MEIMPGTSSQLPPAAPFDQAVADAANSRYINDARFHVHGIAVSYRGRVGFWRDPRPLLEAFTAKLGRGWGSVTVIAHNTAFDLAIPGIHYGIFPEHGLCTRSMATAIHGRGRAGLGSLAARYGLPAKGELKTEGHLSTLSQLAPSYGGTGNERTDYNSTGRD